MCQWTPLSYFAESGYALCLTNGNRVYAGSFYYGVFLTTNDGTDWTQTSLTSGNDSIEIDALAANGNYIYAGNNGLVLGVSVSTNYGTTWFQTLTTQNILSLAVSGSTVYAGTYGSGVYRSTDNGTSWTQTTLNNQYVNALCISGDNIFAGTSENGVYISANNGMNWTQTSLGNQYIWSVSSSGNNIYAGTGGNGIYYSSNSGSNWTHIGLNGRFVFAIVLYENLIFAGDNIGFYLSSNNGVNWTEYNDGFAESNVLIHSILVNNNYIFAGTDGWGIYRRPMLELIGIRNISTTIPDKFMLFQNYPNPFNPTTKIRFSVPSPSPLERAGVRLIIYDILGREAAILVNEKLQPGTYEVEWNASQFPSGVYFYRLQAGDFTDTKKLILLK